MEETEQARALAEGVVMARDASYVRRGYRSFEHADFEARAGRVTALLSVEAAPVRDILLTIAGVVRRRRGRCACAAASAPVARGSGPPSRPRAARAWGSAW